jgi:hypothetical protein
LGLIGGLDMNNQIIKRIDALEKRLADLTKEVAILKEKKIEKNSNKKG